MVTATRCGALSISFASSAATSVSDGERPSRTALVESPISARQPSAPSARSFFSSVGGPMTGVGSIFQSPVCSTLPNGVRRISALDSGIECATEHELDVERPDVEARAERHLLDRDLRRARLACELGLEQRRGERRRVDRHLQLRPEVHQRAEMVLVGVGEDDAGEVAALLDQIADVRQDQIDARQVLLLRERRPRHRPRARCACARRRGRRARGSCRSRRRRRAARTRVRPADRPSPHRCGCDGRAG